MLTLTHRRASNRILVAGPEGSRALALALQLVRLGRALGLALSLFASAHLFVPSYRVEPAMQLEQLVELGEVKSPPPRPLSTGYCLPSS